MKASIKFRDDQKPLVRAKVPISILGLPFCSGVSAGDSKDLRFDLTTSFDSGPAVRVSYRPNDTHSPFSLVIKTGVGVLGSPVSAPLSMTAEFNLLGRGGPGFFLHFRPRIGDFSVVKSTGSASAVPPPPPQPPRVVVDHGANGVVGNGNGNGVVGNVFAAEIEHPVRGINGILSGIEIMAMSVLPVKNRAMVKFRWGVRVPAELRGSFLDEEGGDVGVGTKRRTSWISSSDLPMLVMRKISIEQVPVMVETKKREEEAVTPQLDVLKTEQGMLRKAVDELRAEIFSWKNTVSGRVTTSEGKGKGGDGSRAENWKNGRRTATGAAGKEELNEELKKALMGATGGGN